MKNTRWAFKVSLLPIYNILLGFNYQAGECKISDNDSEEEYYFEEYNFGIIFLSFSVTKFT